VPDSTSKSIQNCNGSATAFPFTFGMGATAEVKVTQTTGAGVASVLLETTNYSVACTNNDCSAGGTVNTVATCPTGSTITIERNVPLTQDSDFVEGMPTLYETFEDGLDKLTRIAQQQRALISDIVSGTITLPSISNYYHLLSNYGTINDAITDIGGVSGTILCDSPVSLGANTNITSNITFIAAKGCLITTTGFTLTFSGSLQAGYYQIFTGTGTVTGLSESVPEHFGAVGDGTTNDYAAINAAINAVKDAHGTVYFSPVLYRSESPILAENIRGITLQGVTGQFATHGTRILGVHTGKAVVSLVGSNRVRWKDIQIGGDASITPKTGLLVGRSSASSAGDHVFDGLQIYGSFSVMGYYNVASEGNTFNAPYIYPTISPIAAYGLYQDDREVIGGLTAASTEFEIVNGGTIGNDDVTATSTALKIDAGSATGHLYFNGTMLVKTGGDSFIEIKIGYDALPTTMPIVLNVFGESGATNPDNGIHFTTQSQQYITGLTINARFQSVDHYILYDNSGTVAAPGTAYTHFIGADIKTPYWGAGAKPSELYRVDGSRLQLYGESSVTIGVAYGNIIQSYAEPTFTTTNSNNLLSVGINTPSNWRMTGVSVHANNAAAIAGGLGVGSFYRITGTDTVGVVY
jgi:hypothetical protein